MIMISRMEMITLIKKNRENNNKSLAYPSVPAPSIKSDALYVISPKTYDDSLDIMQHQFLQDEVNQKEDKMMGIHTGKDGEISDGTFKSGQMTMDGLDEIQHQMLPDQIHEYEDKITPM